MGGGEEGKPLCTCPGPGSQTWVRDFQQVTPLGLTASLVKTVTVLPVCPSCQVVAKVNKVVDTEC